MRFFFPICPVVKTQGAAKNQNFSRPESGRDGEQGTKIRDNIQDFHARLHCNILAEEHESRIGSGDSGCLSIHKDNIVNKNVGGLTNGKKVQK